jgi:ABC-type amino acid transport system permease subunit
MNSCHRFSKTFPVYSSSNMFQLNEQAITIKVSTCVNLNTDSSLMITAGVMELTQHGNELQ